MRAICIGHSTFDTTLPMENYPEENIKYRIKGHIECGGGPASNGAYLLAKWGMDTTIASAVGNDYYGSKILEDFEGINANTKYLELRDDLETTSSYIIANMSNGSRTVLTAKKESIKKLSQNINEKYDLILIDGEHPETAKQVLNNNPNAISIIDAGRLTEERKELCKMVTYVVCSHDFAEEFSNKKTDVNNINQMIEIYEELKNYFKTNIIITLEANGSFTEIDGIYRIIPSIKVKALDSTGAGDIFHGAFTYFIGMKYPLEEAIRYASIAGAISVTRIGSRKSIPKLEEVLEYGTVI